MDNTDDRQLLTFPSVIRAAIIGSDDKRIVSVDLRGVTTHAEFLAAVRAAVGDGDVYLAKAHGNLAAPWLKEDDPDLIDLQQTDIPANLESKYLVKRLASPSKCGYHDFSMSSLVMGSILALCVACFVTYSGQFDNATKRAD